MKNTFLALLILPFALFATGCSDSASVDANALSTIDSVIDNPIGIDEPIDGGVDGQDPVDTVLSPEEEAEPIDSVVEVPEEEGPVDPVVEVPEEEEPVDPVVDVPEEEEPVDPVVEVPEEEEPVDPVVEVPEEEEPVDPVVEVPEEEEPVDPVVEVPEEEEPVDPVVEVPEEEEPVDPVVEVPEEEPLQCSSKRAYVLKSSDSTTNITPHRGPLPADVNYNYYSWSGHPIIGSTPKGYEGQFFLYEDGEGAISFNFLFSVDNGGSADNKISLDVVVKNNDSDEQIILSDDRLEIKKISSEDGKSVYQAKMRYWKNTDGGIIGPFTGDDLSINVKLNVVGDTSRLIFYSADGNEIDLGSEFEILANGEVEECSVAVDEEIERNACIDKEYIVRRTEIEDAKWFDEYEEMISNKKEKITVLREEYKLERKEVVTKFNEEIKEQTLEIHEIVKTSRAEQKKLVEYYETKLTELTEIHKKEREVLISELDTKIEEVQTEESRQVCTKQKGLFGFLKRLFCHVVRFIGKAIGAFFKAGEDALLRFLERVGLLGVQISSSTDLIEVKELAVSKLDIEYEEAVKTLIEERDKKVKELVEEYEVKVIEQKAVVVEIKSNKVTAIKELHAELKKEIKAVSETLNIEIKAFKKNAVKIQDAVHREFADSIKECL